jgi:hypothetical protein
MQVITTNKFILKSFILVHKNFRKTSCICISGVFWFYSKLFYRWLIFILNDLWIRVWKYFITFLSTARSLYRRSFSLSWWFINPILSTFRHNRNVYSLFYIFYVFNMLLISTAYFICKFSCSANLSLLDILIIRLR